MTERTCAISGSTSDTKHYVLKTTEGEELISPEALFHTRADDEIGRLLLHLASRVEALERAARPADPIAAEADRAAAPVKRDAAKKAKAPAQRKASD